MFSIHKKELIFSFSSPFEFVSLDFEPLKVGCFLLSCICEIAQNSRRPCLTSHIFDLVDPIEKVPFALYPRG